MAASLEHGAEPRRLFAGKYVIERTLGHGGMGVVFAATHSRLGHQVAIKVLGRELREYPELVARFEREARAAGSLSSPHAVRVLDVDTTRRGTPFIVMELLVGSDLGEVLERDGPRPPELVARWIVEACDAVDEAHRLGIVHRDLKPSNLFLATAGETSIVKVLDFGVAKYVASRDAAITRAVSPLGTPEYMSPEQVRSAKEIDARTDVWSLGVTMFELVTGTTPFAHESASACIAAIAADPVPDARSLRPDLPRELAEILARALRKDPAERYASVRELVAALTAFLERPRARLAPAPRSPRARRAAMVLALASLAAVGVAVAAHGSSGASAPPPAPAAAPAPPPAPAAAPAPAAPAPAAPASAAVDRPEATPSEHEPARPPRATHTKRPRSRASAPAPRVHGGLSGPGF